jgi:hydroxyethylthiazole kinase-like sugar kinase family protein
MSILSVLALTIASQLAIDEGHVNGPGTLLPTLLDKVSTLQAEDIRRLARIKLFS